MTGVTVLGTIEVVGVTVVVSLVDNIDIVVATVIVLVIGAVEVVGRRGVTMMLVETVGVIDTTDITAYYWHML